MPSWSNTDNSLSGKPKWPKERTLHGVFTLYANAAVASGQSTLTFANAANVSNGMFVSGINIATNGPIGFNEVGPTVANVQGGTITLSSPVSGAIANGANITFARPIKYTKNTFLSVQNTSVQYNNTYNANTILLTTSRYQHSVNANSKIYIKSNSYGGIVNAVAASAGHVGWNYVKLGTGYVKFVTILNGGNQYGSLTSGYLTISPNTAILGSSGAGANVYFTTNANGSIVTAQVNANGSLYVVTPNVSAPFIGGANASNAIFSVTMGGRANRIQVETLVAMSNVSSNSTTSGTALLPGA